MSVDRRVRWLVSGAVALAGGAVVLGEEVLAGAVLGVVLLLAWALPHIPRRLAATGRRRRRRARRVRGNPSERADFLLELAARERALERVRELPSEEPRGRLRT